MKKSLIFIILFSICSNCIAQNLNPKKSDLYKLFRKSIEQDSRKKIRTLSNPWTTNNKNELYLRADTIKFVNRKKPPYSSKYYCEVVNWSFYRKNKFFLVKSQSCDEPASVIIGNKDNNLKLKLKKTNIGLILELQNSEKIIDRFLVISVSEKETEDVIVLKRLAEKASG